MYQTCDGEQPVSRAASRTPTGLNARVIVLFLIDFRPPFLLSFDLVPRNGDILYHKPLLKVNAKMKNNSDQERTPIAENLKQLRGELSQAAFARFLGISQPRYANYELGNREPDLITLCNIATITGKTTDELLGRRKMSAAPPDRAAELKREIEAILKKY